MVAAALGRIFRTNTFAHYNVDLHGSLILSLFLEEVTILDEKLDVFLIFGMLPMFVLGLLAGVILEPRKVLLLESRFDLRFSLLFGLCATVC